MAKLHMISNMKKITFILLLLLTTLSIIAQAIEIPAYEGIIIEKNNYTLHYNEKFEQADWVAYELTKSEVLGSTRRKDSFKVDPAVKTGSATLSDYKGSGYDRGHLAPAADMKMSSESMGESFYMSNMSPQVPEFNRGIWAKLESTVRTWAVDNDSLYIDSGPVLTKAYYPTIGANKVAVPDFYYKVVLDYTGDEVKAIGFILPNKKSTKDLQDYAVTVDEVESITGLDFYPGLDDSIESALESSFDVSLWSFKQYRASQNLVAKVPLETVADRGVSYWINSSSYTRHISSCKYYDNTKKGYFTYKKEGKACGVCGG
jgi:endonuclease G, mitochondrial